MLQRREAVSFEVRRWGLIRLDERSRSCLLGQYLRHLLKDLGSILYIAIASSMKETR